jgi:hypothetical protein
MIIVVELSQFSVSFDQMQIVGRKALLRKSFKWKNRTVDAGWFIAEDAFQNERL